MNVKHGPIPVPPTPPTNKKHVNGDFSPDRRPTTAASPSSASERQDPHSSRSSTSDRSSARHYPPPTSGRPPQIFLFVNPTSGGNAAAAFTKAGLRQAILSDPDVVLYVADIRDGASGKKAAFLQLKATVEEMADRNARGLGDASERVYAIMAGGDGTVLWGISEIWEHQIDDSFVAVGVIPYGTGNDFAKALEWNAFNALNPFQEEMKSLKDLVNQWLKSPVVLHDIWSIDVHVRSEGEFKQIDSKTRTKKIVLNREENSPCKILKAKMSNYFSLGAESRIGIGFDRHRKKSAFHNKVVYMNEGVKKVFLHHRISLESLITELRTIDGDKDPYTICSTDPNAPRKMLKSGSLIAVNIPSFASGLDIWHNARRIGLGGSEVKNERDLNQLLETPQVIGDGRLEWVSFSGISALGAEQILEGQGKRIHQGGGPFELLFKDDLPPTERIYFQIDGEFYQMTCPEKVRISLFRKIQCVANGSSTKSCTLAERR